MAQHSAAADVSDREMETVLDWIDEDTKRSIDDLAEKTGYSQRHVQRVLAALMERGRITSTPDWQYRESRRSDV